MIRATGHHARRLHHVIARRQMSSSSMRAGGTTSSSSDNWSVVGGSLAVGLSALGAVMGLTVVQGSFKDNNENSPSSSTATVAMCEMPSKQAPTASWQDFKDVEGKKKTHFRTIPVSELNENVANKQAMIDGGNRSERAFTSAVENSLFNTYEDGADDWEEQEEEDTPSEEGHDAKDSSDNSTNTNHNAAVQEHFVSFSPCNTPSNIQPRMSIRHTNRKSPRSTTDTTTNNANVLASSMKLPNKELPPLTPEEKKVNDEAILKRIKTIRKNKHGGPGQNQVYTKKMYFYQSAQVKETLRSKMSMFALPSSIRMGSEMAYLLGTELNCIDVGAFTDGETSVKIEDMIRGKEVFVICTTTSTNAIMELLLTISALRRGSAKRICAVIPYYGYCRQDRKMMMKREPIAAADMAHLLEEMGVDSVITVDLHNPLLKGFFSPTVPVDHLMPGPVAAAYFYEELFGAGGGEDNDYDGDDDNGSEKKETTKEEEEEEPKEMPKITVVAAHENQVFRANGFRNALQKLSGSEDIRVALISNTKALNVHEKDGTTTLVGDVKGRKCIIVDDIINTGGTMRNAIDMVDKSGASEVYAWATHGVLHLPENDTPEKIQDMDCLKYLLISNSVAIDRDLPPKIRKLSIAPLLAESIARAMHRESISSMLTVKAQKTEK